MYQLLPRNDPTSSEDIQAQTSPESSPCRSPLSSWAVIACIICTIANLASIYIFPPSRTLPQSVAFLLESPRLTRQEISKLRHPSQFVGLDRIHQHLSSDAKPFVNKPFLSARIDESSPDQSFFDVDQRSYTTSIGIVSLEHHRVMVTPTVSTILQFHALDYGMEACELRIVLPAPHAARRDEAAKDVGEPSFKVSDLPITIRLSQLDMQFSLDAETVSYRTQPRTLRDIANFSISDLPATFSHNFTCKMEEVLTFKLGCQSPECHIEWWQNSEIPGDLLFSIKEQPTQSRTLLDRSHFETALVTLISGSWEIGQFVYSTLSVRTASVERALGGVGWYNHRVPEYLDCPINQRKTRSMNR